MTLNIYVVKFVPLSKLGASFARNLKGQFFKINWASRSEPTLCHLCEPGLDHADTSACACETTISIQTQNVLNKRKQLQIITMR